MFSPTPTKFPNKNSKNDGQPKVAIPLIPLSAIYNGFHKRSSSRIFSKIYSTIIYTTLNTTNISQALSPNKLENEK